MRTRWGVMISGNGSTLQALIDRRDHLDLSVVLSSRPTAYGIARARRAGIPVEILPIELRKKESREQAEQWFLKTLRKYRTQKLFLAGFMRILSKEFIDSFGGEIINVHPSLLPKYKGATGFEDAFNNGDRVAGVTIHRVVSQVDSGEHLLQRQFEIPNPRDPHLSKLFLHITEQRLIREVGRGEH